MGVLQSNPLPRPCCSGFCPMGAGTFQEGRWHCLSTHWRYWPSILRGEKLFLVSRISGPAQLIGRKDSGPSLQICPWPHQHRSRGHGCIVFLSQMHGCPDSPFLLPVPVHMNGNPCPHTKRPSSRTDYFFCNWFNGLWMLPKIFSIFSWSLIHKINWD